MAAEKMIPLTPMPPAPQQKVDPPAVFSDKAEVYVAAQVKLVDEINSKIIPAHNATVEPMTQVLTHLTTILAAPGKAAEAAASAAAGLVSEKAAAASEKQAKASEKIAVDSEAVAVTKAAEALASQTAAATSEVNAKASELFAKSSETSALDSKNAAAASETAAAASASEAFADAERSKRFADDTEGHLTQIATDMLVPQIVTDAVQRATDIAVTAADRATADAGRAESARDTAEEISGKFLKDYQVETHMVTLSTEMIRLADFVTKHILDHHHGYEGITALALDAGGEAVKLEIVEI